MTDDRCVSRKLHHVHVTKPPVSRQRRVKKSLPDTTVLPPRSHRTPSIMSTTQKRKRSSEKSASATKRQKNAGDTTSNVDTSSTPDTTTSTTEKRNASKRAYVLTEEEEEAEHRDTEGDGNGSEAGSDRSESVKEETAEDELGTYSIQAHALYHLSFTTARLQSSWKSPLYAFFEVKVRIGHEASVKGPRRYHEFRCDAKGCKGKSRFVRRYLGTSDSTSTSNLKTHAKRCWGEDNVKMVCQADSLKTACDKYMPQLKANGKVTKLFERMGKGTVTYSHTAHTTEEAR